MSNEIKTRPLTPTEQKYTYAQSMQLEGQTGTIGHLRGDFATTGYGFYTTWFDTRPQWKSDEFKADLDTVINALREDKGLLHNCYDMSAFARHFPESVIKGNYCTEYGFRVDTEKHAFLLRCNPTKGDYNFYCYCYMKYDILKHPNVKLTADGGQPPYIHGEPTQAVATLVFDSDIPDNAVSVTAVSTSYELLSDEDLEEIFNL